MDQNDLALVIGLCLGGIFNLVILVLVEGAQMCSERNRRIRLARYRAQWKKS